MPRYWWLIVAFASMMARSGQAEPIDGRVLEDHSGAPVISADVRVFKLGAREVVADLDTDGDGRFRAPDLAPGEYRLEISKRNYIGATVHIRTGGGSLFVRLVRCGVISGQIADQQGQPVTGAYVFAMPFARAAAAGHALVDDLGRYRLYDLPPGRYAVAVAYGASTMAVGSTGSAAALPEAGSGVLFYPDNTQPRFFAISGGEEHRNIDFTLTPATLASISGKVEHAFPDGRFWLALTPVGQPALAAAVTQAQPDGSFQFQGIPTGSYYLFAAGPANARGAQGALLGPEPLFARMHVDVVGQNIEGLSLAAKSGRSVEFVLRAARAGDGDACPRSGQVRLISLEDWAVMFAYRAEIGPQGAMIYHLAPGRYRIEVEGLGNRCYSAATQTLDLTRETDAKPVEVLVTPAGEIRGRLTGATADVRYTVVLLPSEPDRDDTLQIAFPGREGRFEFAGLRPGRYRIAAQPAEKDLKARWVSDLALMAEIRVPGGVPTDVELPAPKPEEP